MYQLVELQQLQQSRRILIVFWGNQHKHSLFVFLGRIHSAIESFRGVNFPVVYHGNLAQNVSCKSTFCSNLLPASHHSFLPFPYFQKQKPSAETSWNTFSAAGEETTELKTCCLVCVLGREAVIKVSLVIQLNRWQRLVMRRHYEESEPK